MLVPAKINLYLHVQGKRQDGYHLLDTLIVPIDIYDEITIKPAAKFTLEITGPFADKLTSNDNIITRAINLMAKKCNKNANLSVTLVKNIPVGAGLGGGSSDAAASLILLNQIWQAELTTAQLAVIGLKLGADVPVFINQKPAFVAGIGEILTDINNFPELYFVLVYPNIALATADIFKKFILPNTPSKEKKPKLPENTADWLGLIQQNSNQLENTAIDILPILQDIINDLAAEKNCHAARMSGSGSTCFGVFTNKKQAEQCCLKLTKKYPNYWVKTARYKIILETAIEP